MHARLTRPSETRRTLTAHTLRFCPSAAPLLHAVLLPALFLSIAGCGSHHAPQVGAITVTDSKGAAQAAITSIAHGTSVFLDVTLSQDLEGLGADWSVTCSSALAPGSLPPGMIDTSCGTFTPYHTLSGPVPAYPGVTGIVTQFTAPGIVPSNGTVTVVVHASSLPSSTSSFTLKVT